MSVTTALTLIPGTLEPCNPNDPATALKRIPNPGILVSPGEPVFQDGRGKGAFLGIAMAEFTPEEPIVVLARGKLKGFSVLGFALGTPFFLGDNPRNLSTFPNASRPEPLATVVAADAGGVTKVLDIQG